jgi:hypothetical protein
MLLSLHTVLTMARVTIISYSLASPPAEPNIVTLTSIMDKGAFQRPAYLPHPIKKTKADGDPNMTRKRYCRTLRTPPRKEG